jgi:hypothetical protein
MGTAQLKGAATARAVAALSLALITAAGAEVSQRDGVRVKVTGSMTPTVLPRTGTTPIGVSVAGHITPTEQAALPKLTKITIEVNRHGHFDPKGIPLCRLGHINPSTTNEAIGACRSSLIGEGSFSANVKIPEQSPFPSLGKILAFNGKLRGRPAIFAHIYGTKPVPTSYVLPFSVSTEPKGAFATTLTASLPQVTGEWGYVTGISLSLQPRVLSAGCPAPRGASKALFPLARTTFAFEGGLALSSILNRTCKVK